MPMRCPRCKGFMITAQLNELWSSSIEDGSRCLICGEIIDPVIEGNRRGHGPPIVTRARVPGSPTREALKRRFKS